MLAERRDRKAFLFPASAGMNRPKTLPNLTLGTVPRRRGDEPKLDHMILFRKACSPQARG